jgi:GT2 family glycosyltransferase
MDAVIVTYNSAGDLRRQLGHTPLRDAFQRIIVVDNASTDDSVQVARDAGVEVIARRVNDGLAAAVNEGVRRSGSEYVALLNPDVLLDDSGVPRHLADAFAEPSVGLVAPALVLPDGTIQDSARNIPGAAQLVVRRLMGRQDGAIELSTPTDVPWVVAAFVIVRRTAFDDIGGFDPGYILYFEDVDFCVRLWSGGWRVHVDPTVTARHEHQASSRQSLFGWAMRRHLRSAVRFFRLHPDLMLASGRRRLLRTNHTRPTDDFAPDVSP